MDVSYLTLLPRQTRQFQTILDARATYSYYNLFVRRPKEQFGEFFHTRYKLLHAASQRRSTEPAIQNWPPEARQAFVSRYKGGKIVAVDFRNVEARLFAWQAGCPKLLAALLEGGYPLIASQTFGGPLIEKHDPKYKVIKATVLAVLYNMTPWLYGHNVWVESKGKIRMSDTETHETLEKFFKAYPEIFVERERRKQIAWNTGTAFSSVGVPIQLPILPEDLLLSDPKWQKHYRKRIENQAVNYPTQQLAGYVTACGLVDVIDALVDAQMGTFSEFLWHAQASCQDPEQHKMVLPIAEVHDELVFDIPNDLVDSTGELLKDCLVKHQTTLKRLCPEFDCPLDVELIVGDYWRKE
jgi:DNA polymerase I-like protein with 3'-5' exonuclease and polymerase domains